MVFDDVEKARQAYNDKRKKVKKKATTIVLCIYLPLLLIAIIFGYRLVMSLFSNFSLVALFPVLAIVAFAILIPYVIIAAAVSISTSGEIMEYKKAYKGYFVEKELAKTFSDIQYKHNAGLDKEILASTGMINTGDRYSSNDLTIGKYKDVEFTQADVRIEEEHEDNDGNKHYITIFKGRFMIFEFPKKFASRMMLSHFHGPTRGINPKTGRAMQRIETESIEFNKCYLIYAEDGVEAFYILTPDFMESAQELGRSHNDRVSIYFVDNKMIVGINDGDDVFEPPNPKLPLDEKSEATKIANEISLATNIVDKLKLDRKIR